MLFYRFECKIPEMQGEPSDINQSSGWGDRGKARNLAAKGEAYCGGLNDRGYLVAERINGVTCIVAGLFHTEMLLKASPEVQAERYLKEVFGGGSVCTYSEITEKELVIMLHHAEGSNLLSDDGLVAEPFGLDRSLWIGDSFIGTEILIGAECRAEQNQTERLCCIETLAPELERIRSSGQPKRLTGHPVQYMVRTSDAELSEKVTSVLLSALFLPPGKLALFFRFLHFPGDDPALGFAGLVLELQGLLSLGPHAPGRGLAFNLALPALGIDPPFFRLFRGDGRTEYQPVPMAEDVGVYLVILGLRPKGDLADLVPAAAFPLEEADPERVLE